MAYNTIEQLLDLGRPFREDTSSELHITPHSKVNGLALTPVAVLFLDSKFDTCPEFDSVVCGAASVKLPEELRPLFEVADDSEHLMTASIAAGSGDGSFKVMNLAVAVEKTVILFQALENNDGEKSRTIIQKKFGAGGINEIESTDEIKSEVWKNYRMTTEIVNGIAEWQQTPVGTCADCPVQKYGLRGLKK